MSEVLALSRGHAHGVSDAGRTDLTSAQIRRALRPRGGVQQFAESVTHVDVDVFVEVLVATDTGTAWSLSATCAERMVVFEGEQRKGERLTDAMTRLVAACGGEPCAEGARLRVYSAHGQCGVCLSRDFFEGAARLGGLTMAMTSRA